MCIIISRPSNHSLSFETLEIAAAVNNDGWGTMLYRDGEVIVERGMHFEDFKKVYEAIPADQPMAIHFRWRTHGDVDLRNAHPYVVLSKAEHGRDLYLMHNGVIHTTEVDKSLSDTWHWVTYTVRPMLVMNPDLLEVEPFRNMLEDDISGSRILLLDSNNRWIALNQHKWHKRDGCFYSTTPPTKRDLTVYSGEDWDRGYYRGNYSGVNATIGNWRKPDPKPVVIGRVQQAVASPELEAFVDELEALPTKVEGGDSAAKQAAEDFRVAVLAARARAQLEGAKQPEPTVGEALADLEMALLERDLEEQALAYQQAAIEDDTDEEDEHNLRGATYASTDELIDKIDQTGILEPGDLEWMTYAEIRQLVQARPSDVAEMLSYEHSSCYNGINHYER